MAPVWFLTEQSSNGKHRRMGETIHRVNGVDICAEVRGPEDGVQLLLVMAPAHTD